MILNNDEENENNTRGLENDDTGGDAWLDANPTRECSKATEGAGSHWENHPTTTGRNRKNELPNGKSTANEPTITQPQPQFHTRHFSHLMVQHFLQLKHHYSQKYCCGNFSHKLCCGHVLHKPCCRSLPTGLVVEIFPATSLVGNIPQQCLWD